ncbi:MAG: hybrid sensor histidine kinase/response regulator [Burkholderiales bacterium]
MTLPATTARLLEAERVRHLYGIGYFVVLVVVIVAAIISVAIWPLSNPVHVTGWFGTVVALQFVYAAMITIYRKRQPPPEEARFWGRLKVSHSIALGLTWSIGPMLMHRVDVPETSVYLALGVAANTSASTSINAFYPPCLYGYLIAAIVPFMAYLLQYDDRLSLYLAAGLGCQLLFLCTVGTGQIRTIRENILLRFEKDDLLDHLRQQTEVAEQARAVAEASSAEKTRFFGAASHDLRQPVHALGLYVSLLLRRAPPDGERRTLIGQIASCVGTLERLLNALLDVYRTDDARDRARVAPMPLQPVVDAVVAQGRPEAEAKGLELTRVPTRLWVRADRAILERIVGNLVSNAIRYTERGRVVIGIRRGRDTCDVVVADTGIGISAADRTRIFDEFYQVGNPERNRSKGFGLGLAIVRRLCFAMKYRIEVESKPGRGSLFRVTLPVAPVGAAEEPALADPGHEPREAPAVLLLEDDPVVRDAMERLLEDWGIDCRTCDDGDDALAALAAEPDRHWHVLLDYRLAGSETGLDVADRIRQAVRPLPPMTLVTGESDPQVQAAADTRGIHVLRKPLKPLRLRAVLAATARPH